MKRATSLLLALLLLVPALIMPSAAGDYAVKYGAEAEALWYDGLFLGTGTTFALDKPLTRAEGATMAVRLLGKDEAAKAGSNTTPFTDVPVWAAGYVSYAYQIGMTNGVSDALFGADQRMTATQFLTLVLRALGYDDSAGDFSWDKAEEKAAEIGLIKGGEFDAGFLRDHAAYICYNALDMKLKGDTKVLRDTVACPGQLKSALVPSPTADTLPTGKLTLTPAAVSMKPGETASVDVSAYIGNSSGFKMTVASSNKNVVTSKWDGSISRGSAYTTGTVELTAVAKGTAEVTVMVYNSDMTLRYYSAKAAVTVDAAAPSPSPTATPKPSATPKPTATPTPTTAPTRITEYSFRTSADELYGIPTVYSYLDFWLTGAEGYTVSPEPIGGDHFGCSAAFYVDENYRTGVSHYYVRVNLFNDTQFTQYEMLQLVVRDAEGNFVERKSIPIQIARPMKYTASIYRMFGDTYKVEAGKTEDHSVQIDKRVSDVSVKVFIEDGSIARFIDATPDYTYLANGTKSFSGYFKLNIKGLKAGKTTACVYTYVGDQAWQRQDFTIEVAASGSVPESCPLCEGRRICVYCSGQGYTRNPLDALEKWICTNCGGTGKCPVCHGTGLPPVG